MGWSTLATAAGAVASTAAAIASRSPANRYAGAVEELMQRRDQLIERERTLGVRERSVAQRELSVAQREHALAQREDALREHVTPERQTPGGRGYLDTDQQAPSMTRRLDQAHAELADQHRRYAELQANYQDLATSHDALVVQVLNDNAQRFAPAEPQLQTGCSSRPPSPLALIRTRQRQSPA